MHVIYESCPAPGRDRCATKEDYVLSQTSDAVLDETATEGGVMAASPTLTGNQLLDTILQSLDDDKAEDVVTINLRGKSEMADFMVIASGRSTRQVSAIAEKLTDRLKADFQIYCKVEGKDQGDWVLIDAGDVIIHVFRPEVREFYQLEKMWMTPAESSARA